MERVEHRALLGLTKNDVSPLFTPLYHAGGLGAFSFRSSRLAARSSSTPGSIQPRSATVAKERCTVVLGVPTIWKLLLEHRRSRSPTSL